MTLDSRSSASQSMWHPMVAPRVFESREALVVERGEGVHVFDSDGRRYLDAQGGLWCVNVGHGRKEIIDAITAQLQRLAYYNTFQDTTNAPAQHLAARLVRMLGQEGMSRVSLSGSGSDAVETSLKLARQFWKLSGEPARTKFLSLKYGYHGANFGGTSLNGSAKFRSAYEPLLPGCFQLDSPWPYRNPWTSDPQRLGEICADLLDREIVNQGPGTVAAFIAEPVQGAGGVIVPPANYWPLIRKVCDHYSVLLIADEVVTGFGRTGSMFGARAWGVRPDIMCLAKGINSGYVPLGATIVNERVAHAWETDSSDAMIMHGYTYSGHPVACAAANAALQIVEAENLPQNAAVVGEHCLSQLLALTERYPFLGEARGKGLMLALELVQDKATKQPFPPGHPFPGWLRARARGEGLIIRNTTMALLISPPLTFAQAHVDELVSILDKVFATALRERSVFG